MSFRLPEISSPGNRQGNVDRYTCRTPHFFMHSRCTACSLVCVQWCHAHAWLKIGVHLCVPYKTITLHALRATSHTLQQSAPCTGTHSPPLKLPRSTASSAWHFCGTATSYSSCYGATSTMNSYSPADIPHNSMVGQQRQQISELQLDKFSFPSTFSCWKTRVKNKVTTCSDFSWEAMLWIKEVEVVDSVGGLKFSR